MECEKVGTLLTGEIDCADFKVKLLANKDKPAIINVNIGTFLLFHCLRYFPKCSDQLVA